MATPSTESDVWVSEAMQAVLRAVERVGPTRLSVLITGESGTGKEVVARALHQHSAESTRPLVVVDCAAIPPTLMESELFGHKKGAFTGAVADRPGLVAAADGGTFFLDEIGELPPAVQSKLLRLLEDGSYRRVGDSTPRTARLRTIAATNRDIEAEVSNQTFRADLYHRLNGCRIHLPPLRERRADIVPLIRQYLAQLAPTRSLRLHPEMLRILKEAPWPGNVRELVNCAHFIASLSTGPEVRLEDLPPAFLDQSPAPEASITPTPEVSTDLPYKEAKRQVLDRFESVYIRALLERHGGNVSAAARAAGIDRRSIQRMVKRLEKN